MLFVSRYCIMCIVITFSKILQQTLVRLIGRYKAGSDEGPLLGIATIFATFHASGTSPTSSDFSNKFFRYCEISIGAILSNLICTQSGPGAFLECFLTYKLGSSSTCATEPQ